MGSYGLLLALRPCRVDALQLEVVVGSVVGVPPELTAAAPISGLEPVPRLGGVGKLQSNH